jgi:hypothetical protein
MINRFNKFINEDHQQNTQEKLQIANFVREVKTSLDRKQATMDFGLDKYGARSSTLPEMINAIQLILDEYKEKLN